MNQSLCFAKRTKVLKLLCVCVCVEVELLKERMAKLLLGEDMSGSGEGVCPALAISNAITNLYGT